MTQNTSLKPLHVDGFRLEAWNEQDATIKNNLLVATTAENMTVPTAITPTVVRLQSDLDLWYDLSTTAVIPTDDTGTATFLPAGVERWITLRSVTAISLVSSGAAKVCGLFWE